MSIAISHEWIRQLVAKHCPEFYIHSEEQYMPCSAEYFIQSSKLCARHPDNNTTIETLVPQGCIAIDGSTLVHYQDKYPHSELWMELDPDKRCGVAPSQIHTVPVYANVKLIMKRSTNGNDSNSNSNDNDTTTTTVINYNTTNHIIEAIEINYITLFAYNGAYTIAKYIKTGVHDGDIEHITARIDFTTGALIGMWYNSHRSRDGEWVCGNTVPRSSSTGRCIAYIALNGHGNYPRCGTIMRHFFLGNDRCDDRGHVWRPERIVLLPYNSSNSNGSSSSNSELMMCPSRGCLIDQYCYYNDDNTNNNTNMIKSSSHCEVIDDYPCRWLLFKGNWGTTTAMSEQQWFHSAETPVSRTLLQRLFLHVWPETDRVR